MFKPRSFLSIVVSVVAFFSGLATILVLWEPFTPLLNAALSHSVNINFLLLTIVFLAAILIPFFVLNSALYFARAKIHNLEMENAKKASIIKQSRQMQMTDVVTGIPNQMQFFEDLKDVTSKASYASPFQLIFIDLNAFGEINNKYGYATGDKIIEYFAKAVYGTMRRDESVYKMPFDEKPLDSELWQRAYRKHTGGDEFLFMIEGSEADAVGFLVRLQRRIMTELTHHIQAEILHNTDWSLSFSAAVIPVYPNDTKEDVFQRAHEGMRVARQPGSTCRVFWTSKKLPTDFPDGWQKKIYEDAIEMFSQGKKTSQ